MAHSNEELMRRGYEAFADGDMETLDEIMSDDVTWHNPGRNPFAGDYEGKQEVFGFFGRLSQEVDSFSNEIHDVLANDDHVVALVRQSLTKDGETFEDVAVHVAHIEDGQLRSMWTHPYDQFGSADFWG